MNIEISTKKARPTGSAMKTAREALGMTKTATAANIGVSLNTYMCWEQGKLKPIPERLPKISEVLNLPVDQIPVRGGRKPSRSRPVIVFDAKQAERIKKYAPYRERRLELGLQQSELAELAGTATSTISEMERWNKDPHWETRQKIRRALGWPEERRLSIEERNAEFFRMDNIVHWVLYRHREYLLEADADLEDAYQDLALCALRAIDRYDPDGGAAIENYLICQLKQEVKNIRHRAIAKGLVGNDTKRLPYNAVVSFDALTGTGYEMPLQTAA